jgi:hypothetical protein
MKKTRFCFCACAFMLVSACTLYGQYPRFKVLAFYSRTVEKAHVDFADDAIQFFKELTLCRGACLHAPFTQITSHKSFRKVKFFSSNS